MNFEQYAKVILEDHLEELEDGSLLVEEGYEDFVDESLLSESIVKRNVVRKGRPRISYTSSNPNYKIVVVKGKPKEVKISPKERASRRKGGMAMAKKNAQKSKQNTQKRLQTMKLKSKE